MHRDVRFPIVSYAMQLTQFTLLFTYLLLFITFRAELFQGRVLLSVKIIIYDVFLIIVDNWPPIASIIMRVMQDY